MRISYLWPALILLPCIVSCSTTSGIVKQDADPKPEQKREIKIAETDGEVPVSEEEGVFHIIGENETLRHICHVYGLDWKKVARINKLEPPYILKVNDSIFLPASALIEPEEEPAKVVASQPDKAKRKTTAKHRRERKVAKAIRGKRHPDVPLLRFPVSGGVLTSPFGYRWGVFHKGLDIAAPVGRSVRACADGRVVFAGSKKKFRAYGKIVLLEHDNGIYTQYAHLDKIYVKRGSKVKGGQKIAAVGNSGRSTGPHLHLEVRVRNAMYNPLAYFSKTELTGMKVTKRFVKSPMGPVKAHWRIPDLLAQSH